MSLVKTADDLGYKVRKQGKSLGGSRCPVCGTGTPHSNRFCIFLGKDRKERWKCLACGNGGDLIDFIVAATGCSVADAFARTRNGVRFNAAEAKDPCPELPATRPSSAMSSTHVRSLRMGLAREPDNKVLAYLRGRGISMGTIEKVVDADQLRFLPSDVHLARKKLFEVLGGQEVAESCGLLTPPKKWPAVAFRPIVGIMPMDCAAEFRMIEDSEKFKKSLRYGETIFPFFFKASKQVKVVEGLIDLLSCIELGETRSLMAIPGTYSWRPEWFSSMQKHGYDDYFLGMDADEAGEGATKALRGAVEGLGLNAFDERPPSGKDWNDYLKSLHLVSET